MYFSFFIKYFSTTQLYRTQKGLGPRKASLLVYPDDDASDLTDLGITGGTERVNGNQENDSESNSEKVPYPNFKQRF